MSWVPAFAGMTMLVLMLLFTAPAFAQTFPELAGQRVVDQADLLSSAQETDLARKSAALEQQTGRQFVVATVNSLEGREIEDYGYRLGRHWAIGTAEEDDGVILLVAPNEKKVRIETGYGAEGFLPDILAGRIIRNAILPRFRDGDMPGGIVAGADAILETMRLPPDQVQERAAEAARAEAEAQKGGEWFAVPIVLGGMVLFFVLLAMARGASGHRYHRGRRRRRRGWDAGDTAILLWGLSELAESSRRGGGWGGGGGFGGFGGGGGFGGFSGGGGSFGGGGASGGW